MTHTVQDGDGRYKLKSIMSYGTQEGGECLDISEISSQQNMNVVSDAMYWDDVGWDGESREIGESWVWIRMSQKTPFHPTRMQVDYKGASNVGKFHVHAYQSDNLDDCTSVGGHYNPFNM